MINLLGYIRLSFLKCSFFIIYFFQLCHNGSALPCPPNTYVKCNETVSLAHCIKWYQSKWSPSLTRGVLRASPYPLKKCKTVLTWSTQIYAVTSCSGWLWLNIMYNVRVRNFHTFLKNVARCQTFPTIIFFQIARRRNHPKIEGFVRTLAQV